MSVCSLQPLILTQPGHLSVGRCNVYQPNGDDALRLGSKCRTWFVCGWQVKLCDPLVTHRSYLSALEIRHYEALYKFTFFILLFTFLGVGRAYFNLTKRTD